jgi:hypothetical protein
VTGASCVALKKGDATHAVGVGLDLPSTSVELENRLQLLYSSNSFQPYRIN